MRFLWGEGGGGGISLHWQKKKKSVRRSGARLLVYELNEVDEKRNKKRLLNEHPCIGAKKASSDVGCCDCACFCAPAYRCTSSSCSSRTHCAVTQRDLPTVERVCPAMEETICTQVSREHKPNHTKECGETAECFEGITWYRRRSSRATTAARDSFSEGFGMMFSNWCKRSKQNRSTRLT